MRRSTIFVVALFILAGGVALVAVADHRHKNARMGPADVASWYCQNHRQRCQEPQAADIEEAWQHRELVYRVSFWAALSLGGLTVLGLRLRLHPSTRDPAIDLDDKSGRRDSNSEPLVPGEATAPTVTPSP